MLPRRIRTPPPDLLPARPTTPTREILGRFDAEQVETTRSRFQRIAELDGDPVAA
jgi:hypothetical protein